MKILLVTATRIGDAVLSTGLLGYLVDRYPEARFTIVAGPVAAPLFEAVPRLERVIALPKRTYGRHWLDLYRLVAPHRWDMVVDLRHSALTYLLLAKRRYSVAKRDDNEHRVRQLARLMALVPPPSPRLWVLPVHERRAVDLIPSGGPVLAIGPTANWGAKQWRAERFAELALRLTAPKGVLAGARVAVIAAAHERAQAEPVLAALPADRRLDLIGKVDLLTAAAAVKRTVLFIGNDTGLMHIAAATGTPTLGLFGPSPPERYAPWGEHAAFVATGIAYRDLVTAPDFDHRNTATLMDSLSVEAAEEAVARLWARVQGAA